MTTRHSGYFVVLEEDIREDDAEALIIALRMIKGVVSVKPVESDFKTVIAAVRRDMDWTDKLNKLIAGMRDT